MNIKYVYSKIYIDTEEQLLSFNDESFKNDIFNILESLFLYDYEFFINNIHNHNNLNIKDINESINFSVKNIKYKKELKMLIKLAIQFSIYNGIQFFNAIDKDEPYFLEKLKQLNSDYILINKDFFEKIQEKFSLSIKKIKDELLIKEKKLKNTKYIQDNLIKDF